MTEKKQADMEGRGEGGIPKVKVGESYKKELLGGIIGRILGRLGHECEALRNLW